MKVQKENHNKLKRRFSCTVGNGGLEGTGEIMTESLGGLVREALTARSTGS